jgi:guanylate kinase
VDYYFRTRAQIEALRPPERFAALDVRGDLQALDLVNLATSLERGDAFFEGNPYVGRLLQTHPALAQVRRLSVFLAPLSKEEILFLKDPARNLSLPDQVTDVMRRKLLRRTRRQKGELSLRDLEVIERRAGSAFRELQEAIHFEWVIPNHDGEDSDNWEAFYYPLGDARRALLAFVDLLEDRIPPCAEKWEADLFR